MKKYRLYYKERLIGELSLSESGNVYHYQPDIAAINALPQEFQIFDFLKNEQNGTPASMPFFESRINSMNKFNLSEVGYVTDGYLLQEIK